MNQRTLTRRAVLVTTGSTLLAGCITEDTTDADNTNQSEPDGTDARADSDHNDNSSTQNTTADMSDDKNLSLRETTLNERSDCPDAAVTFGTDTITIVGCVTGANGCHVPALDQTETTGDTLIVTVESREDRASGEVCTDAITQNGYELELLFAEQLPQKITVVHNDMHGRQTVLTTSK